MYEGSCLCGEVKFRVEGEFESFFLCHCKYCQKDSGSAHSANLFSNTAKLQWTRGLEKVKTFKLPSTRHVKSFCQVCSSALPNQELGFLAIPAGSLDTKISIRPQAHIFHSSRASWEEGLEGVPRFEKLP
jgi:hypothetical protein